jgi:transcription antitermination factor NusG
MKKWYLICTKPGQETLALDSLQGCGFQCFYPTLSSAGQQTEPLFPRYLFAQFDDPLMGQTWSTVRTAPGVARIVNTSAEAQHISDELILFIRARCLSMAPGLRFDSPAPVITSTSASTAPSGLRQRLETLFSETNSYRRVMGLIELISHRPTAAAPRLQLAS